MAKSAWGASKTELFYKLEPENILRAVEEQGFECTGVCFALNSYENRVYEVQLEPSKHTEKYLVSKFYRPGRWTEAQIQEEHNFLWELHNVEVPVITPLMLDGNKSLKRCPTTGLFYCLYRKVGGRSVDELDLDNYERLGRLIARMHEVGAASPAHHRLTLNAETYAESNLEYLLENNWIPLEFESRYKQLVEAIVAQAKEKLPRLPNHRIHGDCHFGNILWQEGSPYFLDFDDMVVGPAVQDLWLLLPGRDEYAQKCLRSMIKGYESMRDFPNRSLGIIEILRALRFIHFAGWIARRWEDPAFRAAFPYFVETSYWQEQTRSLEEQWELISRPSEWG